MTRNQMRTLVYGAGAVGGYFGGKLARGGNDVWFVARGRHLEVLRTRGLTIRASDEQFTIPPETMIGDPAEAGPVDVVLLCVKSYDVEAAMRHLSPLVEDGCMIISLQNGIDNEARIQEAIPQSRVYGGVAYIYATMSSPGEITEGGGPRKIVFGPMDQPIDDRALEFHRLLKESGISAELTPSIRIALWKKFVFITGVAGLTAITRLTLGEILACEPTRSMLREAMDETRQAGKAEGIDLPDNLVDSYFQMLGSFRNDTRSSLYYDLHNGKPMEVDALSGTVIRIAQRHAIPVPVHRAIYASLLPHHLNHWASRNLTTL